jgi:hypothetical protein
MSMEYRDPAREDEPTALPDIEVFWFDPASIAESGYSGRCYECGAEDMLADGIGPDALDYCMDCAREAYPAGFYYWSCFPGCMPDSGMSGPYASEAEALADAREDMD